jgi:hypothetical protein
VIVAGLSVALFLVSGFLSNRGLGGAARPAKAKQPKQAGDGPAPTKALGKAQQPSGPLDEAGLDDEIAAILKRRGIS